MFTKLRWRQTFSLSFLAIYLFTLTKYGDKCRPEENNAKSLAHNQ